MQILDETTVMVNPATGLIDEQTDATIDATDMGYRWGYEDGRNGEKQSAFYWPPHTLAWYAYHEGYKEGAIASAILTGETRRYWDPAQPLEVQAVSWNGAPTMGLYRCPVCKRFYDPTYGHQCSGRMADDYVPFQQPAEAYAYIGAGLDDEPGYAESVAPYLF